MKKFWSTFLAALLAVIAGGILYVIAMCFVLMFTVSTVISTISKEEIGKSYIPEKSILKLDLLSIHETENKSPFAFLFRDSEKSTPVSLSELVETIERAADDKRIRGIYLNTGLTGAGMASLKEVREALEEFKKSGKWILSYADVYTQKGYYLSSVADKVFLNPVGMMQIEGLSTQSLFYKNALKKLGVEMMIFKVGTYKGAVEPYMLDGFSDANREQIQSFMTGLWEEIAQTVSKSRSISVAEFNNIATTTTFALSAEELKTKKLIDGALYERQVKEAMCKKIGVDDTDDLRFIAPSDLVLPMNKKSSSKSKNKIAVYIAEGNIAPATTDFRQQSVIDEKTAPELLKLANDDNVKAVVLRVNSPGGSAFISDQIWDAVCYIKSKKPIVVSMGDYAASGGYYISCAANYIFAEPVTITGSIGIFGMFPNLAGTADKISLNSDEVKTHENAGMMSNLFRSLTDYEKAQMQKNIERGYDTFISRVAQGRKMSKAMVDSIGHGRVWTGKQAIERKLVDELGGLDEAIVKAASLAGVSNYKVIYKNRSSKSKFLDLFIGNVYQKIVTTILPQEAIDAIDESHTLYNQEGLQAIFPYELKN